MPQARPAPTCTLPPKPTTPKPGQCAAMLCCTCRQQAEDLPPGARQVEAGQVSMMTYPMQRLAAFKQQGERQQHFGLCLKVGLGPAQSYPCPSGCLPCSAA